MYQLPSASDQFAAALSAPIPFLLAVLVVAVAIWGLIRWLYQWRYDGVIEKLNAALRLGQEENRIAKEKQTEADATIKKLTNETQDVQFKTIQQDLLKLQSTIDNLGKANTLVDEALSRGSTATGPTVHLYAATDQPIRVTSPSGG